MKGKETVTQLLERPWPTPAALSAYLGTWEGSVTGGGDKSSTTLKLWVENGRVRGRMTDHLPDEDYSRDLEYVQLTPDGLDFGMMNGMNPRGLIVYAGKLQGGVLSGKSEMRGIYFKPFPDYTGPDIRFSFKKAAG